MGLVEFEKYAILEIRKEFQRNGLGLVEFEKYAILRYCRGSKNIELGLVEFEKYAILHLLQHIQQQRSQYGTFQKKECFKLKKKEKYIFFAVMKKNG